MANKSAKGGRFEREIAVQLSKWWAAGREDVFWRSTSSGARATTRAKAGKQTAGHYGDICATDPIGQPLIDLITFELKCGYSADSIYDWLDRGPKAAVQTWERFICKAWNSHQAAGSFAWAVVSRRNGRSPWIFMPPQLWEAVCEKTIPANRPRIMIRDRVRDGVTLLSFDIRGCRFEHFISFVSPASLLRLHKKVVKK